jgi:hypothetical protein
MRRTHREHNTSALTPIADMLGDIDFRRNGPIPEVPRRGANGDNVDFRCTRRRIQNDGPAHLAYTADLMRACVLGNSG